MKYNIYFNTGFNSEQQKINDDVIIAENEREALELFAEDIRSSFNPDFELTEGYYAVNV